MEKIALSVAEAAGLIGVSTKTMYQWAKISGFPAVKIGGRTIVYYEGLKDWIREQAGSGSAVTTA